MATPPCILNEQRFAVACFQAQVTYRKKGRERGRERHTCACAEGWLWKHLYFCVYSPSKQMRKQFEWAAGDGNRSGGNLFRNGNGNCRHTHMQRGIFHGICFNWLIDVLIGKSNCCGEFYDIFAAPPPTPFMLVLPSFFLWGFSILFFLFFFFLVFASCFFFCLCCCYCWLTFCWKLIDFHAWLVAKKLLK